MVLHGRCSTGGEEIGYFQDFLPALCNLWRVVKNPEINPYYSFKIEREGQSLRYDRQ
jgi:hypothetical protein